jgi:hypothetical protein
MNDYLEEDRLWCSVHGPEGCPSKAVEDGRCPVDPKPLSPETGEQNQSPPAKSCSCHPVRATRPRGMEPRGGALPTPSGTVLRARQGAPDGTPRDPSRAGVVHRYRTTA